MEDYFIKALVWVVGIFITAPPVLALKNPEIWHWISNKFMLFVYPIIAGVALGFIGGVFYMGYGVESMKEKGDTAVMYAMITFAAIAFYSLYIFLMDTIAGKNIKINEQKSQENKSE